MRNCLILGSGRSGTSMAAGVLSQAGYFMGNTLYSGDEGNPKGYYEDLEINSINEELLAQVVRKRPSGILGNIFFRSHPIYWQRWLAQVPVGTSIPCPAHLGERIQAILKHEPYCFKDPRFCYTLSVWRRFTDKSVFLCVFRHPGITVHSLVKEAQRDSDIRHIKLNFDVHQALQVWSLMYRHIVEVHYPPGGEWIFFHYNQFLDGTAYNRLEEIIEVSVNRKFIDRRLNRSRIMETVPQSIVSLYRKLCDLAGYPCDE